MSLTFDELRKANVARCESPDGFDHPLDNWSVAEWGCAVSGEVGEACNIAKKLLRVRDSIPGNKQSKEELQEALIREIADAVIYLDLWAASQGIDLEMAVRLAFNAKSIEIEYNEKI